MTNFDERAKDWDSDPTKVERARVLAEAIRATLPLKPEMTALEYGCATGLLSFFLRDDFAHILLADISDGMLDVLADKIVDSGILNMTPVRMDLTSDHLLASHFDVVYSLLVLHHIPDTDTVLQRFYDILNPSGWLVIADLDAEDGTFHTDGTTDVHLGFERESLQKRVEAVGFQEINFSTALHIKKKIGKTEKSFPVFLLTARKS
ncbi:MAG: class I SAM-dependent methyltransferase [Chloroflexi bacterium HGW-Chloroflexi-6]|nr:MAG: class I SAM-dependent methyltransferase [Chloroflexi bacterium HGW-Chloroflexi-6]